MTPRQASREFRRKELEYDRRGTQMAIVMTPLANMWTEDQIRPYNLWPSEELKPDVLDKKSQQEIWDATLEDMGTDTKPMKVR